MWKLAIVIPTYEGHPDIPRCLGYLRASAAFFEAAEPDTVEITYAVSGGVKFDEPFPVPGTPEWERRDRAIGESRWNGTTAAFDAGADEVIMVDTDVIVPIDFFTKMLRMFPGAEAKTCHIRATNGAPCRHLDDHMRQLPDDVLKTDIAGEVIMLRRTLWERMDHNWQREGRLNEDFEMAEKVRAAGARYALVEARCLAD